jgi:hypothetical protein
MGPPNVPKQLECSLEVSAMDSGSLKKARKSRCKRAPIGTYLAQDEKWSM